MGVIVGLFDGSYTHFGGLESVVAHELTHLLGEDEFGAFAAIYTLDLVKINEILYYRNYGKK